MRKTEITINIIKHNIGMIVTTYKDWLHCAPTDPELHLQVSGPEHTPSPQSKLEKKRPLLNFISYFVFIITVVS